MFHYSERLGIPIPVLVEDWSNYPLHEQEKIMYKWESVRGMIPDRIQALEAVINEKQSALNNEESFHVSCQLNAEISELASIINDLWLWFRAAPELKRTEASQKNHL